MLKHIVFAWLFFRYGVPFMFINAIYTTEGHME